MKLHEEFRLAPIKVGTIGISLVLLIAIIASLLVFWERGLPKLAMPEAAPFQSPRLQVEFEAGKLVRELKLKQLTELDSYRWQDPSHQFAKVPIQRALEFLGEQSSEGNKK